MQMTENLALILPFLVCLATAGTLEQYDGPTIELMDCLILTCPILIWFVGTKALIQIRLWREGFKCTCESCGKETTTNDITYIDCGWDDVRFCSECINRIEEGSYDVAQ